MLYDTIYTMRSRPSQTQQLNPLRNLTAHRVSGETPPDLIDASLRHTTALFPHEPTASDGLGRAYDAIIAGHRIDDGCELLEYFIYTVDEARRSSVVGAGGMYRVVERSAQTDAILEILRSDPPACVSFLREHSRQIEEFIWGGRLSIEPAGARSPHIMPHIIHHILSTALDVVVSEKWVPVLLVFTLRDNNDGVHAFYRNLGFEKTGVTLEFAGEMQEVLALPLTPEMPLLRRLEKLTKRDSRKR